MSRLGNAAHWCLAGGLAAALVAPASLAAETPIRRTAWDIRIGTTWDALPVDGFMRFACGSDGGPPGKAVAGWGDFDECPADPAGLHEVYFEYDDEYEFWARAHNQPAQPGTVIYDIPVILSVLFAEAGTAVGVRMVTDNRVEVSDRRRAYSLAKFVRSRFGEDGWTCVELPRAEGESDFGGQFIKDRCEKILADGSHVRTEARYFRKAGQHEFDPHDGKLLIDQFESSARVEILLPLPTEAGE